MFRINLEFIASFELPLMKLDLEPLWTVACENALPFEEAFEVGGGNKCDES